MSFRISEAALRKLVRSLLEGKTEVPIEPNPNVEPLMNVDQLSYTEKTPVDRVELANVITSKILDLGDDSVAPSAYDKLSRALDDIGADEEKDDEITMATKTTSENKLRLVIRKMIRETYTNEMCATDMDEAEALTKKKRAYTSSDEAGGASFDEIAAEFGFAGPAGAKAAVEKALKKMRFLMTLPEDDRDFLILSAMDDYINTMEKSGNITPEDVQLLRSNPQIVQDLEGFRDHLHKFILRGMRSANKGNTPVEDEE